MTAGSWEWHNPPLQGLPGAHRPPPVCDPGLPILGMGGREHGCYGPVLHLAAHGWAGTCQKLTPSWRLLHILVQSSFPSFIDFFIIIIICPKLVIELSKS